MDSTAWFLRCLRKPRVFPRICRRSRDLRERDLRKKCQQAGPRGLFWSDSQDTSLAGFFKLTVEVSKPVIRLMPGQAIGETFRIEHGAKTGNLSTDARKNWSSADFLENPRLEKSETENPESHVCSDLKVGLRLSGVSVVVVDDEPDARDVVKRLLKGCEAEVRAAASPRKRWNSLNRARPMFSLAILGCQRRTGIR